MPRLAVPRQQLAFEFSTVPAMQTGGRMSFPMRATQPTGPFLRPTEVEATSCDDRIAVAGIAPRDAKMTLRHAAPGMRLKKPRTTGVQKAVIGKASDERANVFDYYLADLEAYPTLSKERERELGLVVVRFGTPAVEVEELRGKTYVTVTKKIMDLTADQLADFMVRLEQQEATVAGSTLGMLEQMLARERAVQELTVHNLKFGISKAKKFRGLGVPLVDLVSAANEGLMHAARKFDPDQGRFTTYSNWWIKQYLLKSLAEQGRVLRVPTWVQCDVRKLAKVHMTLAETLGRQPTPAELARELGLKTKKVEDLLVFLSGAVSLDGAARGAAAESADETTLGEMVAGGTTLVAETSAAAHCEAQDEQAALNRVLRTFLSEKEVQVVRLYFGMETGAEMTFHDIGLRVGLSRERVRQMCRDAVKKLQSEEGAEVLYDYWLDIGQRGD